MNQNSVCKNALARANAAGATWGFCSDSYCNSITNFEYDYCNCKGPFSVYPYIQNGICMNGIGTLIPIPQEACFCCCNACSMIQATIADSENSEKPANVFSVQDSVLVADGPDLKSWSQKVVQFSSGTGDQGPTKLRVIHFGNKIDGADVNSGHNFLVVTDDKPFLIKDGFVKKASDLIPGEDELIQKDGSTIPIISNEKETINATIHEIATSVSPTTTLAGHLLLLNGVVAGDYALQLGLNKLKD
jgi:hypothetical protein